MNKDVLLWYLYLPIVIDRKVCSLVCCLNRDLYRKGPKGSRWLDCYQNDEEVHKLERTSSICSTGSISADWWFATKSLQGKSSQEENLLLATYLLEQQQSGLKEKEECTMEADHEGIGSDNGGRWKANLASLFTGVEEKAAGCNNGDWLLDCCEQNLNFTANLLETKREWREGEEEKVWPYPFPSWKLLPLPCFLKWWMIELNGGFAASSIYTIRSDCIHTHTRARTHQLGREQQKWLLMSWKSWNISYAENARC